ncbi:solute carrier family 20 (sodium-dependent phosphate transporter) [Schistosoma bovis]|uniref:Phosphate transporter n=1 Tax=Schistosoma bovis TaxID=6184 RepID=A0A430Q213_SCHBO|nr:solute carrier family 20 (sodium-dependent phosphate transporter) [Schistosoma bovis]
MLIPEDQIWMVVVGFIIAFILAFGIGANDVANSFGTSVGAKVLTLKQACILATICELSGSVLLGSCIWLLVATFFRLPVSGTHSIVGATMGFSLVVFGLNAIQWKGLLKIEEDPLEPALKLIPGFFGTVVLVNSFSIFYEGPSSGESSRHILKGYCSRKSKKKLSVAVDDKYQSVEDNKSSKLSSSNHESIDMDTYVPRAEGEAVVGFRNNVARGNTDDKDKLGRVTNENNGVLQGLENQNKVSIHFEVKPSNPDETVLDYSPNDQNAITDGSHNLTNGKMNVSFPPNLSTIGEEPDPIDSVKDRPAEAQVFSSLQILTAVFGSFAHGGNDVSNAIGPLIGLWLIATTQSVDSSKTTDIWILVYGGVGISVGLWIWGRRVIQTLGEDLTKISPSSGVCIEIGSALTVLIASKIGLPISTTHCKVGSVVFVGRARSRRQC